MEDDERGTSFESKLETTLLFGTGPDNSFAESLSESKDDNTKNDCDPVGGDVEDPMSEHSPFLWKSTCQKWTPPTCHVCNH